MIDWILIRIEFEMDADNRVVSCEDVENLSNDLAGKANNSNSKLLLINSHPEKKNYKILLKNKVKN